MNLIEIKKHSIKENKGWIKQTTNKLSLIKFNGLNKINYNDKVIQRS